MMNDGLCSQGCPSVETFKAEEILHVVETLHATSELFSINLLCCTSDPASHANKLN
jgi:hypothetical protein